MLSLGGNVTTSLYIEVMQGKCRNMERISDEIKSPLSKENDSKGTTRTETPIKQRPTQRLQRHVSLLKALLLAFLVCARTLWKTTRSSPSCISIMVSHWEFDWQLTAWDSMANWAKYMDLFIYVYIYLLFRKGLFVIYPRQRYEQDIICNKATIELKFLKGYKGNSIH